MMNRKNTKKYSGGQAVITAVVFFLIIAVVILVGITTPISNQIRAVSDFSASKQSYITAESASDDALYRLNKGLTLPSVITLSLNSSTSTASVVSTNGLIQITSVGLDNSLQRTAQSVFTMGTGVSFNYGLQSGTGGIIMNNGTINGNVYSNGDIKGTGSPRITGTAIVSTVSSPIADQSNIGSSTPDYSVNFNNTNSSQDVAQSFAVSTTSPTTEVWFYIKKMGLPADLTVKIMNDNSNHPGNTIITSGILSSSLTTTSFGWVPASFTSSVNLTVGTKYWLVLDGTVIWNSSTNYYSIGATNGTYGNGNMLIYNGSWISTSPSTLDEDFQLFLGGDVGVIDGVTIGTGGVGDAQAHVVKNSTIAGNLYCQTGMNNGGKVCDDSRPDPSPVQLSVSQANIDQWKSDATAAGSRGAINIGGSTNLTISSTKVNGGITVGGGAILTIDGTIYATGDINVTGGGVIKLSSATGATAVPIVTDGKVTLGGGGSITGNINPATGLVYTGSYALVVTSSVCDGTNATCGSQNYAIDESGGAGSVVLVAPFGTINFSGGAAAKSASAKQIILGGGSTLTYDSGLANMSFMSGPSGSWKVQSWKEIVQ